MKDDFVGLRPQVQWFSNEMEKNLQANDHKSGWDGASSKWLLHRLRQETAELERAIILSKNVVEEAADVANFAMMIADNFAEAATVEEDEQPRESGGGE